jgi:hypothetical protein
LKFVQVRDVKALETHEAGLGQAAPPLELLGAADQARSLQHSPVLSKERQQIASGRQLQCQGAARSGE